MSKLGVSLVILAILVVASVLAYLVLEGDGSGKSLDHDRYTKACGQRPIDATVDERSFELSGINLGDVAFGNLEIIKKSEVIGALSTAARSAIVAEYLICVVIERGDVERGNSHQINYIRFMLQFFTTGPTSEQLIRWQRDHPIPITAGRLKLPDFREEAGKKILIFKAPSPVREVRFVNAGDGPLQVWLARLPEEFVAIPDAGPWSIERRGKYVSQIVATVNVRPDDRYFFYVESDPGSPVETEIVFEGNWTRSDYTQLQHDVWKRALGVLTTPATWYQVARRVIDSRFETFGVATRDFIASQVLFAVGEAEAAAFALENVEKESPAISGSASYQGWLGVIHKAAGKPAKAERAIEKYEWMTGKAFADFEAIASEAAPKAPKAMYFPG